MKKEINKYRITNILNNSSRSIIVTQKTNIFYMFNFWKKQSDRV